MPGDRPHHDVEEALGATALLEERLGHRDRVVGGAAVEPVEQRRDDRGRLLHRRPRGHAHHELVERGLERRPAEAPLGRGHRQVDVVAGALEGDTLDLLLAPAALEDAHHGQPLVVHLQRPAERGLEAEEVAPHPVADHADRGVGVLVRAVEEAALAQRELHEGGVVRGDAEDARLRPPARREDLPGLHLDLRHHPLDPGHGVADRLRVPGREAGRLPPDLLELVLAVEPLVLHHHVAQAHRVDDLEGLALGAGPDREHGDDRAHPEDDPEHGQERAQRVVAQALEARAERLARVDHFPASPPEAAGPRARFSVGSRSAITSPAASPESSTTREMLCRPITISTGENLPPSRR